MSTADDRETVLCSMLTDADAIGDAVLQRDLDEAIFRTQD